MNILPFDFGSAYQVLHGIGQGASGRVYQGIYKFSNEPVAIKILHSHLNDDAELVQRFVTERNTLISLDNPHIVKVKDLVVDQGMLGIIMELASGPTLGQYLATQGTLAPGTALAITEQIAQGLSYAHDYGVVHRDIKPDNIILTSPESPHNPGVKIADFGIAKILGSTATSTHMVGTAHYMAPEFIATNTLSPSVDVYALGVSLYYMLSGHLPFGQADDNPFTVADHHLNSAPAVIPGLHENLWHLLLGMLTKDPESRLDTKGTLEAIKRLTPLINNLPALRINREDLVPHSQTILRQPNISRTEETASSPKSSQKISETEKISPPRIDMASLKSLNQSGTVTVIKSAPLSSQPVDEMTGSQQSTSKEKSKGKRFAIIGAITFFILVLTSTGLWISGIPDSTTPSHPSNLQDSLPVTTFPSGLGVTRNARIVNEKLEYTLTYTTIKNSISGQVFESISATDGCATPTWDTSLQVKRHSPALTSINATCGWSITLPKLTPTHSTTITATFDINELNITSAQDLHLWLEKQATNTSATLTDPGTNSTSYPLQRLSSMRLQAPSRIKQGSVIPVTIIGVWPDGENELSPIYTTPSAPNPTSILTDITGGNMENLRLTDRCSGAVSITPAGHDMSALHPASCSISATIGNYDLEQTPITITTAS